MDKRFNPDYIDPAENIKEYYEEINMDIEFRRSLLMQTADIVASRRRIPMLRLSISFSVIIAAIFIACAMLQHLQTKVENTVEIKPPINIHSLPNKLKTVTSRAVKQTINIAPNIKLVETGNKSSAKTTRHAKTFAAVPKITAHDRRHTLAQTASIISNDPIAVLLSGSLYVSNKNGHRLNIGDRFPAGSVIKTNDHVNASLLLRQGSELQIAPNTRLAFISAHEIQLQSGRFYCVNRNKEISQIKTPAGNIRLLGTTVDTNVLKKNMVAVTVVEGTVRLSNHLGDALVDTGKRSILSTKEKPKSGTVINTFAETNWYQGKGDYESNSGEIAYFVMPNKLITEVWVVKSDGTNAHRVSTLIGSGFNLGPWISNGNISAEIFSLIWGLPNETTRSADTNNGQPLVDEQKYLIDVNTGKTTTIGIPGSNDPLYSIFSPDLQKVAFCGSYYPNGRADYKSAEGGIWLFDRSSSKVRQLLKGWIKTAPAWSPDNKEIAVSTSEGYTNIHHLVIVNIETGTINDLGINGAGACFSPDGKQLAYCGNFKGKGIWMKGVPDDGQIYVINPTSRNKPVRVSRDNEEAYNPLWSPDGSKLLYVTSDNRICVTNADGTGTKDIYSGKGDMLWNIAWHESGNMIFLTTQNNHGDQHHFKLKTDGLSSLEPIVTSGSKRILTSEVAKQTKAASNEIKEAIYQYALANIYQFDGNIDAMRKCAQQSASIFANLVWKYPLSGLNVEDVMRYHDSALKLIATSNDKLLTDTCRYRLACLGQAMAVGAADHHKFPSDITTGLKWSLYQGWGYNWLFSNDVNHVMELSNCPGTSAHPGVPYIYCGPTDGSEPKQGEVIVQCPLHPDEKVVWGNQAKYLLHFPVARNAAPGTCLPLTDKSDLPYQFENVGDKPLDITYHAINDTYEIKGKAKLLPLAKVYTDETIKLVDTDEGGFTRSVDAIGQPDWGSLTGDDLSKAKEQLEFCRAVAMYEAKQPITNWKHIFDGEPGTLLYSGDPNGSCGAYGSYLRFDIIGPGPVELYQLKPSGRFYVKGRIQVIQTGKICKNGFLDKEGNVLSTE